MSLEMPVSFRRKEMPFIKIRNEINGSGVQTNTNSRWGDYTAMTVDPVDDCTFWYVNEYYTAAGQASSPAGWQTRIASFKLPGC